jgi:hypothetical protein
MKIRIASLERRRAENPTCADAMLAAGSVRGEWLVIPDARAREVFAKHWPERLAELPEPPLPTTASMAANAARALGRTVKQAVTGKPVLAPAEVAAERLAICEGCKPHFRESDRRCSRCGCNVDWKTTLSQESCPIGAWKKV